MWQRKSNALRYRPTIVRTEVLLGYSYMMLNKISSKI